MPPWLPFLPVLFSFLVFVSIIITGERGIIGMAGVGVLYLVGAIIGLYVMYEWIDRRNKHFKRTRMLYQDQAGHFELRGTSEETDSIKRTLR
ncbi:MAG: hypothetical protein F7B60_03660 [Desulfurococcales archaeon]|nr:hypothetical protein [Desulfurococcales archaeon]